MEVQWRDENRRMSRRSSRQVLRQQTIGEQVKDLLRKYHIVRLAVRNDSLATRMGNVANMRGLKMSEGPGEIEECQRH